MDRQVLLRKIMSVGDEVRRLQQDIIALQSIDIVNYPENYSSLSQQVAINSEYIALKLRELVYSTTNINWSEMLETVADGQGIIINYDNEIMEITLPCLIPHRRKKQMGFITAPLYAALENFVSTDISVKQPFERFKHCVICITHVYNRTLFGKGRKRDHDNIEIKGIIDAINTFLLTDDNENFCDIYNVSELSDQDMTRIYIMKKDMFPNWIQRYKNQHQKLS